MPVPGTVYAIHINEDQRSVLVEALKASEKDKEARDSLLALLEELPERETEAPGSAHGLG